MNKKTIDITSREEIWILLSGFYLDTQLTTEDFDRIAARFKVSPYSLSELKEIDLFEVFLLLQGNLVSVAGEWAGFDEAWLIAECSKRQDRRKHLLWRCYCRFWNLLFYSMRRDYWREIEERINPD